VILTTDSYKTNLRPPPGIDYINPNTSYMYAEQMTQQQPIHFQKFKTSIND